MKLLQLDFSELKQRKQQQSNLVVVFLLLLIFVGLFFEYTRIDNKITAIEDSIATSQGRKPSRQVKPSEQDLRTMKIASAIQQKLNFPWHELLAAIEQVKQQATSIDLMAIQPNPVKNEILLSAEAPNLKTMLAFVSLLQEFTIFEDVLLINQHRIESEKDGRLAFSLKMGWRV